MRRHPQHNRLAPSDGKALNFLHANGTVLDERYADDAVHIEVRIEKNQLARLKKLRPGRLDIIED